MSSVSGDSSPFNETNHSLPQKTTTSAKKNEILAKGVAIAASETFSTESSKIHHKTSRHQFVTGGEILETANGFPHDTREIFLKQTREKSVSVIFDEIFKKLAEAKNVNSQFRKEIEAGERSPSLEKILEGFQNIKDLIEILNEKGNLNPKDFHQEKLVKVVELFNDSFLEKVSLILELKVKNKNSVDRQSLMTLKGNLFYNYQAFNPTQQAKADQLTKQINYFLYQHLSQKIVLDLPDDKLKGIIQLKDFEKEDKALSEESIEIEKEQHNLVELTSSNPLLGGWALEITKDFESKKELLANHKLTRIKQSIEFFKKEIEKAHPRYVPTKNDLKNLENILKELKSSSFVEQRKISSLLDELRKLDFCYLTIKPITSVQETNEYYLLMDIAEEEKELEESLQNPQLKLQEKKTLIGKQTKLNKIKLVRMEKIYFEAKNGVAGDVKDGVTLNILDNLKKTLIETQKTTSFLDRYFTIRPLLDQINSFNHLNYTRAPAIHEKHSELFYSLKDIKYYRDSVSLSISPEDIETKQKLDLLVLKRVEQIIIAYRANPSELEHSIDFENIKALLEEISVSTTLGYFKTKKVKALLKQLGNLPKDETKQSLIALEVFFQSYASSKMGLQIKEKLKILKIELPFIVNSAIKIDLDHLESIMNFLKAAREVLASNEESLFTDDSKKQVAHQEAMDGIKKIRMVIADKILQEFVSDEANYSDSTLEVLKEAFEEQEFVESKNKRWDLDLFLLKVRTPHFISELKNNQIHFHHVQNALLTKQNALLEMTDQEKRAEVTLQIDKDKDVLAHYDAIFKQQTIANFFKINFQPIQDSLNNLFIQNDKFTESQARELLEKQTALIELQTIACEQLLENALKGTTSDGNKLQSEVEEHFNTMQSQLKGYLANSHISNSEKKHFQTLSDDLEKKLKKFQIDFFPLLSLTIPPYHTITEVKELYLQTAEERKMIDFEDLQMAQKKLESLDNKNLTRLQKKFLITQQDQLNETWLLRIEYTLQNIVPGRLPGNETEVGRKKLDEMQLWLKEHLPKASRTDKKQIKKLLEEVVDKICYAGEFFSTSPSKPIIDFHDLDKVQIRLTQLTEQARSTLRNEEIEKLAQIQLVLDKEALERIFLLCRYAKTPSQLTNLSEKLSSIKERCTQSTFDLLIDQWFGDGEEFGNEILNAEEAIETKRIKLEKKSLKKNNKTKH